MDAGIISDDRIPLIHTQRAEEGDYEWREGIEDPAHGGDQDLLTEAIEFGVAMNDSLVQILVAPIGSLLRVSARRVRICSFFVLWK